MRSIIYLLTMTTLTACCVSASAQTQTSDQPTAAERIQRATANVNGKQKYKLAYRLKKGDTIRWTVEHVASTRTQMAGETEETASRSKSVKVWEVQSVDSLGKMTFDHKIESVDMWQKIGELDPVAFNSLTDQEPPIEYESVVDQLGKAIATFSINPAGQIIDRKSASSSKVNFGVGDITIPLPADPIPVGYQWNVPKMLSASDKDGNQRKLKSRIVYELIKVKSNNAYISFKTEVLTPVESEKVQSQIMQQMTRGYLVFDMSRGYPIRKEVEWDEKVQGFEGPDSLLEYLGRMTERIVDEPAAKVSRKPKSAGLKPLK